MMKINLDNFLFDGNWSCRVAFKLSAMNMWVVNEEENVYEWHELEEKKIKIQTETSLVNFSAC
jgi:hypothetical protein